MHRQQLLRLLSGWILLRLALPIGGVAAAKPASPEWLTKAERTEFRETARYEETIDYCRRLEKASPWIRVTSFGKSGEGRELPLVIASKEQAFDLAAAAKSGKAVVLIQNGIHAGEIDGKDASLMLLREIVISKKFATLLDHVILLVIPIYNVDGHERFGPWNRINQNGPVEQGWRVTATNLNLNRDYMKADAPETRAWLELFSAWRPDLFIDTHVTDGADFQYDVTYLVENNINVAPSVARWATEHIVQRVMPALDAAERHHLSAPFIFLRDDADPSKGLQGGLGGPRFSTGYAALQNRVAFLIETHMLKDYRTRVLATYDLLRLLLEEVNRDPESLRQAVRQADEETVAARRSEASRAQATATGAQFPLRFRVGKTSTPVLFQGMKYRRELSEVSGGMRIVYENSPMEMTIPRSDEIQVDKSVELPLGYLIPPAWSNVIEVLAAHGLKLERLKEPVSAEFESYRFRDVKWQEKPFEGRHPVTFQAEAMRENRTYAAGSILVRLDQPAAKIAIYLLEPESGEGFVSWGFFDSIFEQKEYAEDYVLEKLAREMVAKDPQLKKEFEDKLQSDREFAGDPRRRLAFFYERSPWWDSRINVYPVARVTTELRVGTEPQ